MTRAVRTIGTTLGAVTLVTALGVAASVPAFAAASAAKKPAVLTAVVKRPSGHPVAGQKLTISFKGTHAAAKGKIVKYTFVAGDKSKAVSGSKVPASLTHTWGRPGTYKMSLSITDSNHKTATVKESIVILTSHLTFAGGGASATSVDAPQVCQPADAVSPLSAPSTNGSQLTGTVTDASGHPLSGIPVTLFVAGGIDPTIGELVAGITVPIINVSLASLLSPSILATNLDIPNITNTVVTNAAGQYSLDALPLNWVPDFSIPTLPSWILGQGSVSGSLRSAILQLLINPQMSVNVGSGANVNYTQVSADRAYRGLTSLKLPGTKSFALQPAGNISGHLVTASGAPVANQQVEFVGSGVTFAVTSAADGSYSMPSVPLGLASLHEITAFGAPVAPVVQGTIDSCIHDVTGLNVIAA